MLSQERAPELADDISLRELVMVQQNRHDQVPADAEVAADAVYVGREEFSRMLLSRMFAICRLCHLFCFAICFFPFGGLDEVPQCLSALWP